VHLSFELDGVAAVTKLLDDMRDRIRHAASTDLADTLHDWELHDMHRRHAHLRRRRIGASTIIRQHSWWETKGRRKVVRRLVRKGKFVPRWSTRPPLRPELFEELVERVAQLVAEKLRW
jgi:hypothetical protein